MANPNRKTLLPQELEDIKTAVKTLRGGGIILYPTDTVWGIGCDATNQAAVARVYALKERNEAKALITLVSDFAMLERTVDGIPDVAYDLIEFSEKPLTIVYDIGIGVAENLTASDGSLAVRIPMDLFSRTLCHAFGRPIVSTSANRSGAPTPLNFKMIDKDIIRAVDYVCTTGQDDTEEKRSSTIMRLSSDGSFKIIRP